MAINDTKNLWESYNGKGFFAEAAEYSERANKDVNGNAIVDTYATKAEVTEKQDALPSSAANQFLQTNANNEITWGTLPEALDKVYIVTYGSSVSVNTVSAERQAGKAVFCSKGNALLPLQAIGSNICSFNGVIGAENSTGMNGLIMAHVELMGTGMWGYSTISIPKPTGTSKTLTIDTDGTVAWTATPVIPQEMTGATAQGAGASGLVPAPAAGDQAKFLKGDGTWDTVADSPLFMAKYTATTGNAMKAAIQSGKAVMCHARGYAPSQFGLLGKCDLNNNKYQFLYIYKNTNAYAQQLGDIAFRMVFCNNSGASWFGQIAQLTFKAPTAAGQVMKSTSNGMGEFDWTLSTVSEVPTSAVGDAGKVLSVNSSGTAEWILPSNMTGATASTDGASGLVPAPLAGDQAKFLKGDGTWGDVPSLPSPTINDSLLLGQADGSETWTALENDVFGTDQLWTGFAGKEFGAARAYADQDGNNIKATYATKEDLNTALGDIESLLAAL